MTKKFRSFEEARDFSRSLKLKTFYDWVDYCKSGKRPNDIPSAPNKNYKTKWKSWGDWLGTGSVATFKRQYCSFQEARDFAHKLKLKGKSDWEKYCSSDKKPLNIPRNPYMVYKKDWKGWGDWLGTGTIAPQNRKYLPFEEARKYVHSLHLHSKVGWIKFLKSNEKPDDIPATPDRVYKNKGWKGLGDWLGTGTIAPFNIQFKKFEEARQYAQSLKLKSHTEWTKFSKSGKRPGDIPGSPEKVYKNKGWKGYGDWLGTGRIADQDKQYRSFTETKKFIRSLGLKSRREWYDYVKSGKKPDDIPAYPEQVYTKENVLRRLKKK